MFEFTQYIYPGVAFKLYYKCTKLIIQKVDGILTLIILFFQQNKK